MKKTVAVLICIALLSAAAWAEGTSEEADRAMIAQCIETYAESFSSGDAETWMDLHEPQAYKMPQNMPMFTIASVADKQQARFERMQSAYDVSMDVEPMEIEVAGDIAYAVGTYTIDMEPRGEAPPAMIDGKFLTVFRQQEDGSWKIWRDCMNSNTPASE